VRQILPTKNKFKQKQNKQIEKRMKERKKNEILIDKKEKAQRT
jgi:hypothetical protein